MYKSEKYEKHEKYLSDNEISNILMQATGTKEAIKLTGLVPKKIENFPISDNLKNTIKEYYIKKERGIKIVGNSFDLKYNETLYNELLGVGIPNNIAKATLRICHNNKPNALLLANNTGVIWNNKDLYLFFDNNEVLSINDFNLLCKEEIKKEFSHLKNDEEIKTMVKIIIKRIKKENSGNNNIEDGDESEEEYENSFESNSNSNSTIIDLDLNFGSNNFTA